MTFPVYPGSNPSGYNLTRSLRFRSSASAYLNRTPASAGSLTTWTWSGWVKRGTLSSDQFILCAGSTTPIGVFGFLSDNTFFFNFLYTSNAFITTQVFRDPSAWYHIVVVADTTNATASNRTRLYVNGVQVTAFSSTSYPSQNATGYINTATLHTLSRRSDSASNYFDGYLAEVNFIDGQALTPSSFGSTNALTGVWQPAKYTGTYGTNGFYLPFTDNSGATATTIGKDFSGNGNNWTPNNISVTAGVTYDSMTDVPTLTSATAANFAVMNPITTPAGAGTAFSTSGGNLNCAVAYVGPDSTIAMSTGKWYWEVIPTSGVSSNNPRIGIVPSNHGTYSGTSVGDPSGTYGYASTGQKATGGTYTSYGASFTDNDVIGIALDMTAGTIVFYKNGVSQGTAFTGLTGEFLASVGTGSSSTMNLSFNFGQRPFSYTPPTGYVALNTYNLPTPTILAGNKVMDATLYTGNGSTQTITNAAGFKPDFVWVKSRSGTTWNNLYDSVRGVNKALYSNDTFQEFTDTNLLTSFNSNGFSIGSNAVLNTSAATLVAWQWQAGQGTTSSNTSGSITSTVSVNASAGFSVVTYTGTGANATVGHGLGVAPSMIIIKSRTSGSTGWVVYFKNINSAPQTSYVYLNSTNAVGTGYAGYWNSTNPTSSVFSIGTDADVSANGGNMVAYCFAPITGYSAFGSYTGNGSSDGTFVYLGFRPKFVMFKRTDSTGDWITYDTARNAYNLTNLALFPNGSYAEATATVSIIDIVSNGFKCRGSGTEINASGGTYIYAAFAENPTKYALAR